MGFTDDARTRALYDAAYRVYAPHGLLKREQPDDSRYPYPDRPALCLCSDSACSPPVTAPEELPTALSAFVRQVRQD
jgi:uncharacterized protein YyaL (SSP411 family)